MLSTGCHTLYYYWIELNAGVVIHTYQGYLFRGDGILHSLFSKKVKKRIDPGNFAQWRMM